YRLEACVCAHRQHSAESSRCSRWVSKMGPMHPASMCLPTAGASTATRAAAAAGETTATAGETAAHNRKAADAGTSFRMHLFQSILVPRRTPQQQLGNRKSKQVDDEQHQCNREGENDCRERPPKRDQKEV